MPQISCKLATAMMAQLKELQPIFEQEIQKFVESGDVSAMKKLGEMKPLMKEGVEYLQNHLPIGYRFDLARELMNEGMNFFGPEEVKDAFLDGFPFPEVETPPIPFSKAELEDAERHGEQLIYRYKMNFDSLDKLFAVLSPIRREQLKGILEDAGSVRHLRSIDGKIERSGWALVSHVPLAGGETGTFTSQNLDLLQRLHDIRELNNTDESFNFHYTIMQQKVKLVDDWIKEFNNDPASFEADSLRSNVGQALVELLEYRHSVAEYVYDLAVTRSVSQLLKFTGNHGIVTRDSTDIGFIQIKLSRDNNGKPKFDLDEFRVFEDEDLSNSGVTFQRFE